MCCQRRSAGDRKPHSFEAAGNGNGGRVHPPREGIEGCLEVAVPKPTIAQRVGGIMVAPSPNVKHYFDVRGKDILLLCVTIVWYSEVGLTNC